MAINDNSMNLDKYRGPIGPCPLCDALSDAAKIDTLTSGRSCRMCMGRRFISHCRNCGGTGQYHGKTVWDGSAHDHISVCTPCGGSGVFAVARPKDWDDDKWKTGVAARNATVCECGHEFGTHNNHRRNPADLDLWVAGQCGGQCGGKIRALACPCREFKERERLAPDTSADHHPPKPVESTAVTV